MMTVFLVLNLVGEDEILESACMADGQKSKKRGTRGSRESLHPYLPTERTKDEDMEEEEQQN
jgi:hypothetical protein